MKLALHYRGPLKSNGDAGHKHQIRMAFHEQLQTLWDQPWMAHFRQFVAPRVSSGDFSFLRTVGNARFAALVTEEAHAVAELRVLMLRPGPVGGLLHHGGDIDNRLKTLFDALSVPPHENQLPTGVALPSPMFCLLEDDRLVSLIEVRTEQLLEPVDVSHVDLTISVRTRTLAGTWSNDLFS
jgi:hypothetical protein